METTRSSKIGTSKKDLNRRNSDDDEFEVQDVDDTLHGAMGTRLAKYVKQFSFRNVLRSSSNNLLPLGRYYITTRDRKYQAWWIFVCIIALWSSLFTPFEFGFFRGLPQDLWILDLAVQSVFLADMVLRFFTAYTDRDTYRLVVDHRSIAKRYIKSDFFLDLLGILPWDTIYKTAGRKEEVRYLVWVRLYRVKKVDSFFEKLEKDIRINYFLTRIAKLLAVEIYCTHTAACIYYYLATTVPSSDQSYTWIGSLTLGSFSYYNFRVIDLGKRYVTSLYWAILTMATVGYGDVHAVNIREMIFVMIYVSFDMILGAYLIGNMTGLIVKGSNTERFRDKMTALIKYMNRNGLPRNIRNQMKRHVRLQFENGTMREGDNLLEDLPASVRAKVAQTLYSHIVEEVGILQGCSPEFLNEIVSRVTEEFFLPGEIVISQGGASDQFYIVCHGTLGAGHKPDRKKVHDHHALHLVRGNDRIRLKPDQTSQILTVESMRISLRDKSNLFIPFYKKVAAGRCIGEETKIDEYGKEQRVDLVEAEEVFGEVGVLCNIPQPYSVRVLELCRVLRLNKHEFTDIVEIYFNDGRIVINNVLESKDEAFRVGELASDVRFLMTKHAAEMTLMVNNASYHGDLGHLKHLVKEGAIIVTADYDGRTPLHLAASKGFELVVLYLIREGANVNAVDKFGVSPLLEAVKGGHDNCLSVLIDKGGQLHLQDEAFYLCKAVMSGNSELLRRLIVAGANVSASDYDSRTGLHLAAAEGSFGLAKMLVDAGADICAQDRWGRTALDEAMLHQHTSIIALLKEPSQKCNNNSPEAFHKLSPALRSRKLSFLNKERGEPIADLDHEEKASKSSSGVGHSQGQGRTAYALTQPQSSDSSKKGRGRRSSDRHDRHDRQSSVEIRSSLGLSPDHPHRMNMMDDSMSPLDYRTLPSRRIGGRPSPGEQPFSVRQNRRITIYPYHPWIPTRSRTPGKVEWVPPTCEDVLALAYNHFGKVGTKVFNQDAGEISSTDLIVDSEKIYVVDDDDVVKGGSLQ